MLLCEGLGEFFSISQFSQFFLIWMSSVLFKLRVRGDHQETFRADVDCGVHVDIKAEESFNEFSYLFLGFSASQDLFGRASRNEARFWVRLCTKQMHESKLVLQANWLVFNVQRKAKYETFVLFKGLFGVCFTTLISFWVKNADTFGHILWQASFLDAKSDPANFSFRIAGFDIQD